MDKKTIAGKTVSVLKTTFLPMGALKHAKESKDSLVRIGKMLKTGRAVEPEGMEADPEHLAHQQEVQSGKAMYMALEEHDRFEAYVVDLGWTQQDIDNQATALKRSHLFRFALIILLLTLLPYFLFTGSFKTCMFIVAMVMFTGISCIKTTCFLVQLEERALWSFATLRARPGFWLFKRAFSIQD